LARHGAGNPRILLADWVDFVGWFGMIIKNNDNGHLIGNKLVSFAVIYLGIRHSQSQESFENRPHPPPDAFLKG